MAVDYRSKYKRLKGKLKYLVYEQECFLEEMKRTQKKLIRVSRDKSFLLDRLLKYETVPPSSSDDEATASSSDESEEEALKMSTPIKARTKRQRQDPSEGAPPAKQAPPPPPIQTKVNKAEENDQLPMSDSNNQFDVDPKPRQKSPASSDTLQSNSPMSGGVDTPPAPGSGSSASHSVSKAVPAAAAAAQMASSMGLLSSHARAQALHSKPSSTKPGTAGTKPVAVLSSPQTSSDSSTHGQNAEDDHSTNSQSRSVLDHPPAATPNKTISGKSTTTAPGTASSVCKYMEEEGTQCTVPVNMKSKSPFCTYHRSIIRKKSTSQPSRLSLSTSQLPAGAAVATSSHPSLSSASSAPSTPHGPAHSSNLPSQPTLDADLNR